ncbi:type I secretion system permease/ATPase [Sinisalibacter aestuarii]|uniref:Protease/lipase ABC transporter permease/ATP-binding protein n=1 Tax=Sinisalibacter aestuarii TaxID=2949426 RepID=A0ABQ5LUZ2_9RHOB|nr:type I secretion system permease/ATPase [Sinisalibacter aestuarii]GKY88799.1 protease/lipase ABC transporter permease/ATP-binding protein [Sinisalibacter aestuarii]
MTPAQKEKGESELRGIRRESRALFWAAAIFSVFVNILMLTGPIYMLQIYDRVLGSRSEATLIALTLLMAFFFLIMGVLDYARGRVLARIGATFQARLDRRVFSAVLRREAVAAGTGQRTTNTLRDLESVQRLLSSPVFAAVFDIPWTPIFLAGILIFHPYLGYLALSGGAVLVFITILNQLLTSGPVTSANTATMKADQLAEQLRGEAEMVRALGMSDSAFERWHQARAASLNDTILSSDRAGKFAAISKTFRMFLQSAMLGLGAWLVLRGELSPGAMIAGSILLGRALAPIDMAIGQWQLVQRARHGWQRLVELLSEVPPEAPRTRLPRPRGLLKAENLTVVPPGQSQASLRMINFEVHPGEALGIIGPSGAGKSSLARTITGVWRPAGGKIRLDGAALDQFEPATLGQHIGYLPQRVQLFDGTIAENIAGLSMTPDDAAVVEAAKKAAAHEMILRLPDGYDTKVTGGGGMLSGGQMQRIGLARAMYGNPVILVLDEPNSNLDNEGSQALNTAVREVKAQGGAILIMAHRPSAITECELLLVLDHGMSKAFGPRDEILNRTVQNAEAIRSTVAQGKSGGVS